MLIYSRSALWAAGFLALALPAALPAQVDVVGTVRDSLTGGLFGGAVVQLVPQDESGSAARSVSADSVGDFRIEKVARGRYMMGFLHYRLDSLGMEAPIRAFNVPSGQGELRVDLALPSARTIAQAICGPRQDTTGVLLGRVVDAEVGRPVPRGSVLVRWSEVRVGRGVERVLQAVRAPVRDDGRYAACGVPTDVSVLVQAMAGPPAEPDAKSGAFDLAFPNETPLLHRDILVAPVEPARPANAHLVGRIVRPDGRPLEGARVMVRGAHAADSIATSGADGAFRLDALPAGTFAVEAIAIGFTPARANVDLRPDRSTTLDLELDKRVTTLETVSVYAAPTRSNTEFARHMREGQGRYFAADEIRRRGGGHLLIDMLLTVPGLRAGGYADGRPIVVGRFNCVPEVYLNGLRIPGGLAELDSWVKLSEIGGLEVYADPMTAPLKYTHGDCASVLVWTKEAIR